MFTPIHDGVPLRHMRTPFVTYAVIGVSTAFYLANLLKLFPHETEWLVAGLGLIPAALFGTATLPDGLPLVPTPLTLVSSLFLHVSFFHLVGNMLFLWVFADNVEDAVGHWLFLVFILLTGATGGLAYALVNEASERPLIGASASVSGVIAAYLMLHPRVKIWGLVLNRIPMKLRAVWGIAVWFAFQWVEAFVGFDDSVGWVAHLAGFASGAFLIVVLHRPDDPLFGRNDGPELTGDTRN